jgi:hypothetical protein
MSTTFCVITLDGQQHNQVEEATVREWYQRHYLRDNSQVIVWGSNIWQPLYQVFDLRQWQPTPVAPAAGGNVSSPTLNETVLPGSSAPTPLNETVLPPAQPASAMLPPGSYVAPPPTTASVYYQKPVVFGSAWGLGIATLVAAAAQIVTRIIHLTTYYSNDVYIVDARGRSLAPPDVAMTAYLLYGLFIVVFLVAGVIYSLWVYRAYKNLRALGHAHTDFTPGWAVGYMFVPIVNLWKPYQAVSEMWRKSDPSESSSGSVGIVFWWICFLALGFANWIGTRFISSGVPDAGFPLVVVSMIANVFAGIMLIFIIIGVNRRQEERRRVMNEQPEQLASSEPFSNAYSLLK